MPDIIRINAHLPWQSLRKLNRSQSLSLSAVSVHTEAYCKAAKAVGLFTKPKFIVK